MSWSSAASPRRVLAITLLVSACQADPAGPDNNASLNVVRGDDRPLGACQVTSNVAQNGVIQNYRYDGRGFLSAWADGVGTLVPQYDATGRLVRAQYVIGAIPIASIVYVYDGGKIARENWFAGGSDRLEDVLVNTWNSKGQLVRRESRPFGVFAAFTYDAAGNAYQVDVMGTDGFLFLSNTYVFTAPAKSPDLTLRGLPYGPQFLNYVFNPSRQTAAKAVVTDAEGNRVTIFDQDPARSVLVAGQQQYPLYQNFFDKISGTFFAQLWTYQNCPGNNFPPDVVPAPPNVTARRQGFGPADFALRGSMRSVRQQIDALKRRASS
ncbi:MAG: hypothetical protein AB1762_04980 [Gemmatimonadota bacterium]